MSTQVRWTPLTTAGVPAALAVIGLIVPGELPEPGAALDEALASLGIGSIKPGSMALARIAGVDSGLVVRWSESRADLFPHGGPAVLRAIMDRFTQLGLAQDREPSPRAVYPEARGEIEARMLWTLSRATSTRALDLLLEQPERWGGLDPETHSDCAPGALRHLVCPPIVAAIGPPNIGKSSLANALAGRTAVVVADVPGTTRDHVGLTLELDGLVVRYLDTPGLDSEQPDALTAQASARAMEVVRAADLVLICQDARDPAVPAGGAEGVPVVRVALRTDLASGADLDRLSDRALGTSAATGRGLSELACEIRRALVPDEALCDPRPWRFWEPA